MTAPHLLTVRDATLTEVERVTAYTSLDYTLRRNAVGDWTLRAPLRDGAGRIYPGAAALLQPGAGIVIRRAGPVSDVVLSGDAVDVYVTEGGEAGRSGSITAVGTDDLDLLALEHAWPDPATEISTTALTQHARATDTLTTTGEDALIQYLTRNLGSAALPRRQYGWLALPPVRGLGVSRRGSFRPRFEPLLVLCQRAASYGGLLFRLVQDSSGETGPVIRLELRTPVTREEARFSLEAGTLSAATLTLRSPDATEALGLGKGQGSARVFTRRTTPATATSRVRRVELREQTTADLFADLQDDLEDALAEKTATGSVAFTLREAPWLRFGEHFWVGDRVSVAVAGRTITDVVQQVAAHDENGAVTFTPQVGVTDESTAALARAREITRRLAEIGRQ